MGTEQPPGQEDLLELFKRAIRPMSQRVELEMEGTHQSWPVCFGSDIFAAETYFSIVERRKLLPPEKLETAKAKFEALKARIESLKDEYADAKKVFPAELKRELFAQLADILS